MVVLKIFLHVFIYLSVMGRYNPPPSKLSWNTWKCPYLQNYHSRLRPGHNKRMLFFCGFSKQRKFRNMTGLLVMKEILFLYQVKSKYAVKLYKKHCTPKTLDQTIPGCLAEGWKRCIRWWGGWQVSWSSLCW